MKKILIISLCLSMILGLCACGNKSENKDKKEENTKTETTVEDVDKDDAEEELDNNDTKEDVDAETKEEDKEWFTVIDENQMFDWTSINVRGKGLQVDNGYGWEDEKVNNFTANSTDPASKILSEYPHGIYEDEVTFCKTDEYGNAKQLRTNVEMNYDKDADKVKRFRFDIYTAEEFYLNDVQVADVLKKEISEKLGEPYVILKDLESSSYNEYYVWRYNGGYIMINFMMKTRYVYVINDAYVSSSPLLSEFIAHNTVKDIVPLGFVN